MGGRFGSDKGGSGGGGISEWNPTTHPNDIISGKAKYPNTFLLTQDLNVAIDDVAPCPRGTMIHYFADTSRWRIISGEDKNKGVFETVAQLNTTYPTSSIGNYALVTETGTFFAFYEGNWNDTGSNVAPDALRSTNNLNDLSNKETARTNLSVYSIAQTNTALAGKVDKETGKGLSTNDLTNALLDKLNKAPSDINSVLDGMNTASASGFQGVYDTFGIFTLESTRVTDFVEATQDVVGEMVDDTSTIDATYNDATNKIKFDLKYNSVGNNHIATNADIAPSKIKQETITPIDAIFANGDKQDVINNKSQGQHNAIKILATHANRSILDATEEALTTAKQTKYEGAYTHSVATGNPHGTTKEQVGLGNADNTSDANKPISTATQEALDLKENLANKATSFLSPSDTSYPTTKASKDALDLKQNITDNALNTTGKTIVGAINEVKASNDLKADQSNTYTIEQINNAFNNKVDKETGKSLISDTEIARLLTMATNATSNQTDAYLLDRANHTGEQAISTITDLETTLAGKVDTADLIDGGTGYIFTSLLNPEAVVKSISVADETARFALTTASVQIHDEVYQEDTQIAYRIIDDTNLDNSSGYRAYAGSTSATWNTISGKPSDIFLYGTNTSDDIIEGSNKFVTANEKTNLETITASGANGFVKVSNGVTSFETLVQNSELGTGINVNKLANGTVANEEFQMLDGLDVSKTIQAQINELKAKAIQKRYVSPGTQGYGSDSYDGKSEALPIATYSKLNLPLASGGIDGSGFLVVHLPSQSTESATFTQANIAIVGQARRDFCGTTGTITANPASSSQVYESLSIGTFVKSGAFYVILDGVTAKTALSHTGTGSLDIIDSDFSKVPLSLTSSGTTRLYNCRGGVPTLNNASAFLFVGGNESLSAPTITAGLMFLKDCIISGLITLSGGTLKMQRCTVVVAQGTTLTIGASGSFLALDNVEFVYPDGTSAKINIPTGVFFSFSGTNTYATTSTLNGTDLSGSNSNYIQYVKINTLNLPNATASTLASFDANKNLVSLSTAQYPNLAELACVKGGTSSFQAQLDAKAPLNSPALTGTPTAPTATPGTNNSQISTNAFVMSAFNTLKGAPTTAGYTLQQLEDRIILLEALLSTASDGDNIIDTYYELLQAAQNFPEGSTFLAELNKRALFGTVANRPTASATNNGYVYTLTDGASTTGSVFVSNGSAWVQVSYSKTEMDTLLDSKQGLDGTLTALAGLDVNTGFLIQIGADSFAKRTISGSNGMSVTNGDGVAGNLTISPTYGALTNTIAQGNDARLGTKAIDETNIGNGKYQKYNSTTGKLEYGDEQDLSGLLTKADNLNSVANKQTALKNLFNVASGSVDNGKIPTVVDGNMVLATPDSATGSGNVSATGISGATGQPVVSLNDSMTLLGRPTTIPLKQSYTKGSGGMLCLTTEERDSALWVSGDIIYNTTYYRSEKYNGTSWVSTDGTVGMLAFFDSDNIPLHYIPCDASQFSRTGVYSEYWTLNSSPNPNLTPVTFTITIATPAVITKTGHGLTNSQRVRFKTTGALPTGITTDVDYIVAVIDANTFRISTSPQNALAGIYIATSGTQSGGHTYTNTLYGQGNGINQNAPDGRGVFLRSTDPSRLINSTLFSENGSLQGDAIRNIIGKVKIGFETAPATTGAFYESNVTGDGVSGGGSDFRNINFDASRVVPTADENRPKSYSSTLCIKIL